MKTILASSTLLFTLILSNCTQANPQMATNLASQAFDSCKKRLTGTPTPRDEQWCQLYFDLRIIDKYLNNIIKNIAPEIGPIGCPNCETFEEYTGSLTGALKDGDPSPQPSLSANTDIALPFSALSKNIQLERLQLLRKNLQQSVLQLDEQINTLNNIR